MRSLLVVTLQATVLLLRGNAFKIEPGIGLTSKATGEQVIVFEHTSVGTGGLVYNRPTPLRINDLRIPRFQEAFGDHSLMLGCGIETSKEKGNVPVADMAPWFWLHNLPNVTGSCCLEAAQGPLYMGGNIESATKMYAEEAADPDQHKFKFFFKYKSWMGEGLQEEIKKGLWEDVGPKEPMIVLEPFSITISSM